MSPRLIPDDTLIKLYQGDLSDSPTLLQWYTELVATGDLPKILFPSNHSLGSFMHYFQPPKVRLIYVPDRAGQVQLAFWGEAVASGVIFLSLWSRPSIRHTRVGAQMVLDIYRQIFNTFHVVCGITKQERLLKIHSKLGYKILARVPLIWGGVEDGWLVTLTRDDFYAACGKD